MTLVATVTFGVGSNFVHLVTALVLAWGFVVGQVCVYGITTRKGR